MEIDPTLDVVVLSDSLGEHQCLLFLAGMAMIPYLRLGDRY
jgi:hypothetical protein